VVREAAMRGLKVGDRKYVVSSTFNEPE